MQPDIDLSGGADRAEWASRFEHQAEQCAELGSDLYARLLRCAADDVLAGGATWRIVDAGPDLRFGQAGPLRLVGGAHRLALEGAAPDWASLLPSCGGQVPDSDTLMAAWTSTCDSFADALVAAMGREVQTNEVARVGGLGLAVAATGFDTAHLVEMGCSGALNLRLDRFRTELGPTVRAVAPSAPDPLVVLGDPDAAVVLRPELRGTVPDVLRLPTVLSRTGVDPFPIDVTTDAGRLTLLSFVWPDQVERFARIAAAIDVAQTAPVNLVATDETAAAVAAALNVDGPRVLLHSIVWQYLPTAERWAVTEAVEAAGRAATAAAPLAWVRFEPDEWDRRRAAVWLRTWAGGGGVGANGVDRLIAHADYHGRWVQPLSW